MSNIDWSCVKHRLGSQNGGWVLCQTLTGPVSNIDWGHRMVAGSCVKHRLGSQNGGWVLCQTKTGVTEWWLGPVSNIDWGHRMVAGSCVKH